MVEKISSFVFELDWLLLLGIYILLTIFYLGFFNYDFGFGKSEIEIKSSLFEFFKKRKIRYGDIKKIRMPHEEKVNDNIFSLSTLLFLFVPFDYKWIQFTTKSNKTYTYYCFGLEYDCYDNCDENDLMENVFREFMVKGVNIEWTKANDDYFDIMTEEAKIRFIKSQS